MSPSKAKPWETLRTILLPSKSFACHSFGVNEEEVGGIDWLISVVTKAANVYAMRYSKKRLLLYLNKKWTNGGREQEH